MLVKRYINNIMMVKDVKDENTYKLLLTLYDKENMVFIFVI